MCGTWTCWSFQKVASCSSHVQLCSADNTYALVVCRLPLTGQAHAERVRGVPADGLQSSSSGERSENVSARHNAPASLQRNGRLAQQGSENPLAALQSLTAVTVHDNSIAQRDPGLQAGALSRLGATAMLQPASALPARPMQDVAKQAHPVQATADGLDCNDALARLREMSQGLDSTLAHMQHPATRCADGFGNSTANGNITSGKSAAPMCEEKASCCLATPAKPRPLAHQAAIVLANAIPPADNSTGAEVCGEPQAASHLHDARHAAAIASALRQEQSFSQQPDLQLAAKDANRDADNLRSRNETSSRALALLATEQTVPAGAQSMPVALPAASTPLWCKSSDSALSDEPPARLPAGTACNRVLAFVSADIDLQAGTQQQPTSQVGAGHLTATSALADWQSTVEASEHAASPAREAARTTVHAIPQAPAAQDQDEVAPFGIAPQLMQSTGPCQSAHARGKAASQADAGIDAKSRAKPQDTAGMHDMQHANGALGALQRAGESLQATAHKGIVAGAKCRQRDNAALFSHKNAMLTAEQAVPSNLATAADPPWMKPADFGLAEHDRDRPPSPITHEASHVLFSNTVASGAKPSGSMPAAPAAALLRSRQGFAHHQHLTRHHAVAHGRHASSSKGHQSKAQAAASHGALQRELHAQTHCQADVAVNSLPNAASPIKVAQPAQLQAADVQQPSTKAGGSAQVGMHAPPGSAPSVQRDTVADFPSQAVEDSAPCDAAQAIAPAAPRTMRTRARCAAPHAHSDVAPRTTRRATRQAADKAWCALQSFLQALQVRNYFMCLRHGTVARLPLL